MHPIPLKHTQDHGKNKLVLEVWNNNSGSAQNGWVSLANLIKGLVEVVVKITLTQSTLTISMFTILLGRWAHDYIFGLVRLRNLLSIK